MSDGIDLDALRDNLPAHYSDCDSFQVYNYGTRQGRCDCTASADIPALIAEVERLTVERDRARDVACRLEQENAEALRITAVALEHLDGTVFSGFDKEYAVIMFKRIVGVLGASDDT